jgi:hypothetical protein
VTPAKLKVDGLKNFEERREHIFQQFVEKMFVRRQQTDLAFGKESTKNWLAGLARQMTQRAQTLFLIEGLQPDWLLRKRDRWFYFMISRGVSSVVLVTCLVAFLASWLNWAGIMGYGISFPLLKPINAILLAWSAMATGSIEPLLIFRRTKQPSSPWKEASKRMWIYGGLSGLAFGTVSWLSDSDRTLPRLGYGLIGLFTATVFGPLFGIIFGLRASRQSVAFDIQTVGRLAWSWQQAGRAILRGTLIGASVSVLVGFVILSILKMVTWDDGRVLSSNWTVKDSHKLLLIMAVGSVTGTVLATLLGGLIRVVTQATTRANEGIRLSWYNATRAGASVGLTLGLMQWMAITLIGEPTRGWVSQIEENYPWAGRWMGMLICGAISGVFLGLLVALLYGYFEIIQHYTLRLLLWQRGYAPRRLVRFLDHASDLIFLQKVGGGYIFIHRLLLEHFAAMESKWSAQPDVQNH